jgi:tagatose 1,6-diphosphate aldolase
MKTISIGKFRGLQRISTSRGSFTCLALDHRQNLRKALHPSDPSSVSDEQLSAFKLDVTRALADKATAVLLDPEVSAAQAVAARAIPGNVGLVVALESTGYGGEPTARRSQLLPGWSIEKARRMGADAVKLLVYYHPDAPTAAEIEAFIRQVADECRRYDLALMLEPLSYSLAAGRKLASAEKQRVVIETARRLSPLGIDVLKAEFPLEAADADESTWAAACAELTTASVTPWILLSAAVDYETYLHQVTAACRAGASGIAVGRAVWQEAVGLDGAARHEYLAATARRRLSRLTSLCHALARPWTDFYATEASFDWYKTY